MSLQPRESAQQADGGGRRRRGRSLAAYVAVAAALVLPGAWVAFAGGTTHGSHASDETAPSNEVPSAVDVCFVEMMIPHHQQAVEMSDVLLAKPDVWERGRRYAEFIGRAQATEVATMREWLASWRTASRTSSPDVGGGSRSTHGSHDAGSAALRGCEHATAGSGVGQTGHDDLMPGMLTEEQLRSLRDADGPTAQRLYLQLMIPHHDGAVDTAYEVIEHGSNAYAVSLAKHVVLDQLGEIDAMRTMITELTAQ